MSQEFRLKNINETRNYLIEEINQKELMSKKRKKVYRVLNYMEHLLILICVVTGCDFHFCFHFFSWYSYRNCEFCNSVKNLCNKCLN